MWKLAPVLMLAGLAGPAIAAERPDWAYPPAQPERVQIESEGDRPLQAPGSRRTYTRAQIDSQMDSPDWFPDEHPAMPAIVAHGNGTTVRACTGTVTPRTRASPAPPPPTSPGSSPTSKPGCAAAPGPPR
jgi:hypothetical protein